MTLAEALRAAAIYVEENKAALAWDGPELPSEEQKARIIAKVSALGHELDGLATASETAQVRLRRGPVCHQGLVGGDRAADHPLNTAHVEGEERRRTRGDR